MNDWPLVELGSLTKPDRSITYGVVKPGDEPATGGVTLIRGGDILGGKIAPHLRTIKPEVSQQYKRTLLEGGELLVSLVGNPGAVAVATPDLRGANLARQVGLVALRNDVNARFIMYALMSPLGRNAIAAITKGSVQQVINLADLKRLRVPYAPSDEQRRIASILGAYDDLIEVNRRRIAVLEAMARNLFEEWFIRFRFPGHEGVEIVESEIGQMPGDWSIETGKDAFSYLGGGTPSKTEPAYWDGGVVDWYTPTDLTRSRQSFLDHSAEKITDRGLKESSAKLFPAFSIMMTSRATLGVFAINTDPATTNQGFITFVPSSRLPLYFLYHYLRSEFPRMEAVATGSTFKEITKGALGQLLFGLPPQRLVHEFERLAGPAMELMLTVERSNQSLAAARDLLLPRLISGELSVAAAERQLEDAA